MTAFDARKVMLFETTFYYTLPCYFSPLVCQPSGGGVASPISQIFSMPFYRVPVFSIPLTIFRTILKCCQSESSLSSHADV